MPPEFEACGVERTLAVLHADPPLSRDGRVAHAERAVLAITAVGIGESGDVCLGDPPIRAAGELLPSERVNPQTLALRKPPKLSITIEVGQHCPVNINVCKTKFDRESFAE
jgi:hypothetical protein